MIADTMGKVEAFWLADVRRRNSFAKVSSLFVEYLVTGMCSEIAQMSPMMMARFLSRFLENLARFLKSSSALSPKMNISSAH
jgi:hypothetical protein